MIHKYFKCTLLTDIVLNASLATEGNMKTLDYIPGSNFWGIVAGQLYASSKKTGAAHDIFHSDKVSFGDAHISKGTVQSYAMPFSLFQDKLNKGMADEKKKVWVHHYLKGKPTKKDEGGKEITIKLEQCRGGYFNPANIFFKKVKQKFSLKSAHSRAERRSKEGAMFGFESLRKGQEFIFSIRFKDETYLDDVTTALIGNKRVGKSKTAQYGQVKIEKIETPKTFKNNVCTNRQLVIYAESNLCFLNEFGQPSFQPSLEELGLKNEDASIDWFKSQVRTYSYSPWNAYRNTSDMQRDVILKGSVLFVNLKKDISIDQLPSRVGKYQAEGLGRVIYNPIFLNADEKGIWRFELTKPAIKENNNSTSGQLNSTLARFLSAKKEAENQELKIGNAIIEFMNDDNKKLFSGVSSSQWGEIRSIASQADGMNQLKKALFEDDKANPDKKKGFLVRGVAAEKYWDVKNGKRREKLKKAMAENQDLGAKYIAKLAAEMAKFNQQAKK